MHLAQRWVLVTGASGGLGRDIARELAENHGANLILLARREARLRELAAELQQKHGIETEVLAADLSRAAEAERVGAYLAQRPLAGVVLNAAVTHYGHVLDQSVGDLTRMLQTNIASVVHLSRVFADSMARRREGGSIMFVTSLTALSPFPTQTVYGASKAFLNQYGLGLAHEMAPLGVRVTVFAPGGIATEMLEVSGLDRKFRADQIGMMHSRRCAKFAVSALVRGRRFSVPGLLNQLLAALMRWAPRPLVTRTVARMYDAGTHTRWRRTQCLGAPTASTPPPSQPNDAEPPGDEART
ncbi:MAG: SDR family NAD(P)-dependent oxidoreductase [Nannocystaceae bacterium]